MTDDASKPDPDAAAPSPQPVEPVEPVEQVEPEPHPVASEREPEPVEAISVLADTPSARPRTARRRRPRWGRILIALVLLASPLLIAAGWFWYQVDPPGEPGRAVAVDIPPGSSVAEIGDRLAARGVIGSPLAFRWYARLSGEDSFQAGAYRLRRDSGARAAIDALKQGPTQRYRKLALPPGLRFDEVADRIGRLPGRSAERVRELAANGIVRSRFQPAGVNSLEGLTWPDTYFVADHEDEEAILGTLVDTFDAQAVRIGLEGAADPYRTVVIASLIQREAGVEEDRPLIAGVVENRLVAGMPLQIDASVVYARGGGDRALTDADFALDSPYNTYRVTGLPPTPISTVTAASLRAALTPADVPYLFYVLTDESGRHAFAVTYEEHQRNIAEARRRGVLP